MQESIASCLKALVRRALVSEWASQRTLHSRKNVSVNFAPLLFDSAGLTCFPFGPLSCRSVVMTGSRYPKIWCKRGSWVHGIVKQHLAERKWTTVFSVLLWSPWLYEHASKGTMYTYTHTHIYIYRVDILILKQRHFSHGVSSQWAPWQEFKHEHQFWDWDQEQVSKPMEVT